MKTIRSFCRFLAIATVALTTLGIIATTGTVQAQVKGLGKLAKVMTVESLQNVEAGDIILMSCPKCKDTFATVVEKSFKGFAKDESKTTEIHLCPMCDTKLVIESKGKQSDAKLVHTCKTCGSQDVSCCVIKKGDLPATGMGNMK